MSDTAIINQVFAAHCDDNAHLPKKSWLCELQQKQLAGFLQRGFPTRSEEQWKYSDTSFLAKREFVRALPKKIKDWNHLENSIRLVFVNGYFSDELSDLSLLPKAVLLCSLSLALDKYEDLIKPLLTAYDAKQFPFASLNTAYLTDGIFLSIPKDIIISTPIHCQYISTQQNNILICPRNIICADANSQVTFIEEYFNDNAENYFTNVVTSIHAEENAQIMHYKIQAEQFDAMHVANLFIMQNQNSVVKSFNLSIGGRFSREDVQVAVQERGAECQLNGLYNLTQNGQHIDNHLHVSHSAERGTSSMLYKGILDKKSRAVFNGKVYVHQNAQQINAQQYNHNLLLSQESEIDTKPELEIYADDVKCTHGATVGQLDNDSLFYLCARGINQEDAMALLTRAFAAEVLNKIENPRIRHYVETRAGQHD
ncbi:MAG: Fe-S cluster assembly protein SufD [Gammaproteobacteria bacterium]